MVGRARRPVNAHGFRRIIPPMTMTLTSRRHSVEDLSHAIEFCYQQGWTDGLPVVPPTERAVRAMLDAAGLEPDQQVAFITNRQVAVTAEKVAVNAVMAGCRPEYMPIVVAAVEALADPRWGYHGPATSTGGAAVAHDRQRAHRPARSTSTRATTSSDPAGAPTPPSGAPCAW